VFIHTAKSLDDALYFLGILGLLQFTNILGICSVARTHCWRGQLCKQREGAAENVLCAKISDLIYFFDYYFPGPLKS